jgi:hypothetical protein
MRLNAPILASLALVVLTLLPATLQARPAHAHVRKAAATTRSSAHRQPARNTSSRRAKPTVVRVKAQSARVKAQPARHRRQRSSEQTVAAVTTRKATSADFMEAASARPHAEVEQPKPVERVEPSTRRVHTAQSAREAARPSSRSRRPSRTERPVPVVSVIHPVAPRPQLQSISEAAATPVLLPTLYNKRGRLIVPPPLKGSHEILVHQNQVADRDGLDRIQNDDDLLDMRNKRLLISLPSSAALEVDDRLPFNRRYCRPWTAEFLSAMARAHYAHFHTPLQVNSAVRTVEFQSHLIHINGNAAPIEGDTASPHLTGQAVDIAKHGLSLTEIAWMRGYLLPLVQQGKIDVEEEFQQACFHISVYKRYLPPADMPRRNLASSRYSETTALAAAMR